MIHNIPDEFQPTIGQLHHGNDHLSKAPPSPEVPLLLDGVPVIAVLPGLLLVQLPCACGQPLGVLTQSC